MTEPMQSTSGEPMGSQPMSTYESKKYKATGARCAVELLVDPDDWRSITVTLPAEFEVYFAGFATEYSVTQGTLKIFFGGASNTWTTRPPSLSSENG